MTYSKYPGEIDDDVTLPVTVDLVTEVKAEVVNRLRDSIIATESTIGADPTDGYATLKDRLDAMQAEISGGGGGGISGSGTDNNLVRWDGTSDVQDSGWNLTDNNVMEVPTPTVDLTVVRLLAPAGGGGSVDLLEVQDAQGAGEDGVDTYWRGAAGADNPTGAAGDGGNIGIYAGWGGASTTNDGGQGAPIWCESGRGGAGDGAFNDAGYGGDAFFGAENGGNGTNSAGGGWGGYLYVYAGNGGSSFDEWPGWGGQVSFESGNGGASYDAAREGGPAGYLGIYAGNGGYGYNGADGGDAGDVEVSAGFGGTIQTLGSGAIAAPGGTVYINGGGGGGKYASAGGNVDITGGRGGYTTTGVPSGLGGWVLIQGGQGGASGNGDGGSVQVRGGNKNNSGLLGDVIIGDLNTAAVSIGASATPTTFYGSLSVDSSTASQNFFDLDNGSTAAVGAAGHVRFRSNAGTFEISENGGAWAAPGGGASPWTDTGSVVYVTVTTRNVAIGASSMVGSEKLRVSGDSYHEGNIEFADGSGGATRYLRIVNNIADNPGGFLNIYAASGTDGFLNNGGNLNLVAGKGGNDSSWDGANGGSSNLYAGNGGDTTHATRPGGPGGNVNVIAANGGDASGTGAGGDGGSAYVYGGNGKDPTGGGTRGDGGNVSMTAGSGLIGGNAYVYGGAGNDSGGAGGQVLIYGGNSALAAGGQVIISGGTGATGNGGCEIRGDYCGFADIGGGGYLSCTSTEVRVRKNLRIDLAINHDGTTIGFYGTTPQTKQTVNGSRGGNAALDSLLTALATIGLITNSTTA